ncbi:Wzz/FepE/Etk N-terminal domain-containing protein [Amylibacter sp.]|nr:Wzz/FepE/Etk N-terminal domain-containing protein [Amylibacter sp.]MDB4095663.1 Wzz/FepE/Etk N-terminal domain-containing protein [Amylibacter sp.]
MQNLLNTKSKDEIDLRELVITLWAYKLFIASTCILGIVFGAHKALNSKKQYSSAAIFKLDKSGFNNISLGGGLDSLANIAGFGSFTPTKTLQLDQTTGRIFIEKLDSKLNFQADPYFNTYNPNSVDPIWKSLIKRAIGWEKSSTDAQEAIWQSIVSQYSTNVIMNETLEGSIEIEVTHVNPIRAAEIANVIMDEIIFHEKMKKNMEQDQQLSYLSNTLAKALSDLEISQSNLKEFALKNSALPLENFAAESFKIDALREQLSRTSKLHEAVAGLLLVLENKTTDQANYISLRQKFPIIDQVEFRRVLGQNEIISYWSWPDAKSVAVVLDTLSERKNRLQSKINASQKEAARSSLALEAYAKLEREAKVAEATYTVLIEQVKAQSMVAGYRPDKTEIYEYASASINPSAPKRSLILAVGAVLGLFVGTVLSLLIALSRGVYYSKRSLKNGAQARFLARVKTLMPLRNKSLNDIDRILVKKPRSIVRDLAMGIHKSTTTQVVVTSSRAKLTSFVAAQAIACYMQSETMKIAIINFSSSTKKLTLDKDELSVGSFVVVESTSHISVLRPDSDLLAIELLGQKDFWESIQSLSSTFNLVFLCADNDNAISLLSALEGRKLFHITLVRTKNTKSAILMRMRSLLPIQGLLYD